MRLASHYYLHYLPIENHKSEIESPHSEYTGNYWSRKRFDIMKDRFQMIT